MNTTSHMLPLLLPDMSLYSLTACAHRMSGRSRGAQTSSDLFGDPNAGLLHDFPSNLGEFCRRTNGAYGEPSDVARKATVLPYFVRFRPTDLEAEALKVMCTPRVDRLKFLLGLPAGPTGASFPLRACVRCMAEDEQALGFTYWHRRHQLPGVYFCQKHGEHLRQSSLRIDRRRRSLFLLPSDHGIFPKLDQSTDSHFGDSILLRLAILSAKVLDHPLPSECSPKHLQATYFHGLKDRGLLTRGGSVRAHRLLNWIRDEYQSVSDFPPYDWILSDKHLAGLMRLVRKPRGNFHSAYHVLLIDALFGSWERFVEVYAWENVMSHHSDRLDHATEQKVSPTTTPDPRFIVLAQRTHDEERSLTSLCREMGIDFQTAVRHLAEFGSINIKRRPKVMTAELRTLVADALRTGMAQRDIAKRYRLSRATVDRICTEYGGLHDEWSRANLERKRRQERGKLSRFLSQHPDATLGTVRQHSDSGYSWLRRNDALWLGSQIARGTTNRLARKERSARVDWTARDMECLAALELLARIIVFEPGERFQPGVVLRKLPRLSFKPRLDRLPQSKKFVTALLDSYKARVELDFLAAK